MTSRLFGLIPAAGAGARFGGAAPKQYHRLAGRPMLHHAAASLLGEPEIETVFVVLAPDDEEFRRHDWSAFGDRLAPLYCGGANRRDSVLNGLVAASSAVDPEDWVLVHDAARPCLGKSELRRLIDEVLPEEAGGILAVPVADTLKRADATQRIAATERRQGLWQAQTPQMFRHGVLIQALERAGEVTDEASAIELIGLHPKLVEGRMSNFKVTYPDDMALAEWILRGRGADT